MEKNRVRHHCPMYIPHFANLCNMKRKYNRHTFEIRIEIVLGFLPVKSKTLTYYMSFFMDGGLRNFNFCFPDLNALERGTLYLRESFDP